MSPITTHVLDTSTGRPASGLAVSLESKSGSGDWHALASGVTDDDGRVKTLMAPDTELSAGNYRLIFETGEYFHMRNTACFFPQVILTFEIIDTEQHYHVPLLLSPFGYTTYRGS